ncbi:phosphotransferase family protein [Blastococcus capsensis]|uniref:phosphotransferase family protein n=1 Tax=Blastococcus capsensis TaxID=1564163 RepID=UPI002540BE4A|nr:aminoglycoside phosphotransferase family protein [Blastococcus capsensis]MDK3255743.1 aminoglycoside phosphotransferase family protein [Blastococcus capsensis]
MTAVVAPAPALDPALPDLSRALSAHPPGTAPEDDCRVLHVEWLPRRRCRVVHEVRAPGRRTTLIAYVITPSGTTVEAPADDPGLPGLAAALNPAHVSDRLAVLLGTRIRACAITPIAYRPATRAVVAYDVEAAPGRTRLYAKVLAEGCERYAAAAAAISAWARGRGAPAPVPDVVAVWRDLGAVVQQAAPGRDLSGVLRDDALPERERLGYAELLGQLLARIHATPWATGPRWSAEDELSALELLLPATCHADPAVGRRLATLLDRLADVLPAEEQPVFSHGAFRSGQVLLADGVLSLLDLDTVSSSDPARDAGNAFAYLSWAAVRGALEPGLAAALQEVFLAGYADGRARLDTEAVVWWTAAAMAKIAGRRFRGLATTEWGSVPELLGRAGMLVAPVAAVGIPGQGAQPGSPPSVDPLDADRMTDVLRRVPALRAADGLRVVHARPLAVAAGRRRVVRYEVEGLVGGPVALVGKSYADRHRSSIAYDNLRLLHGEVFAGTPTCTVPAPVCHLPAQRMVLYREVAGTALDQPAAGNGVPAAGLAARWLATLHGSAAVLARRLDLTHELVDVGTWAACVGDRAPEARAAAHLLAERLAAAAAELPALPEVPIHKDFHAGHVLVVPDGVAVIDLDEARMGDPALDVAHLTACLDAFPSPRAVEIRAAFLDAYGALPGPAPEVRVAFFGAYTNLKIAKQLVTERGPVRPAPGQERATALTSALRRGVACLDM